MKIKKGVVLKSGIVISIIAANTALWSQEELQNTAAQNLQNYFIANYHQFGGDMKKAYERYKELIQSEAPAYTYKGYIHLLFDTGNYAHILQLMPKVDSLFKENKDVQVIFAKVLEQAGKSEEADIRFIELNEKFKNDQEVAFQAANSHLRRKEPENALQVIDAMLNSSARKPNNFIFYFMKAQILLQLNKKNEALANVQKSLELHPKFDKGLLLYALLSEQEGQLNDAIKGYSSFLEVSGSNREIEEHLLQLVFKQKIEQQSKNKTLLVNKQCFDKALALFDEKKYEPALAQIDACLKERPDSDESKILKIQILTALKRIDSITALLKQWLIQEPDKKLWYQTLHLLTQTDIPYTKAIETLHALEKAHPNNKSAELYLADLYIRAQNHEKALTYLHRAAKNARDAAVKSKILFQIGLIDYEAHNYQDMKKNLTQALDLNPHNAPASNLLAYHYASEGKNLKEAQRLIEPVIKKYKNNPHYLDTQALIYLKQQKYADALKLLQRLAQKAPSDYTILVHLGQAQKLSGNTKAALGVLEQAKKYAKTPQETQECLSLLNQWKIQKT